MSTHRRQRPTSLFDRAWLPLAVALLALFAAQRTLAADDVLSRALAIESTLYAYPQRSLAELAELIPNADGASSETRRFIYALEGQALVLAGKTAVAAELANRLEEEAANASDRAGVALAKLIRSAIESSAVDAAKSATLAREARYLAKDSGDEFLQYWGALALGTAARARGQSDEALASLHDALALADRAGNAYRRSSALYQLSVLHLALKQGQDSLTTALSAFESGKAANSAYAMANARMAESAVMELLQQPARELAAMEEALAIARKAQSQAAEGRALVNLADIRLRRKQFSEALDFSRRSLALARLVHDTGLASVSKANMGFALLGLGRIAEGKRLTDEALGDYERSGATADIVDLLDEYARNLEHLGDYPGALALYHRERTLKDEIAQQMQVHALLELQEKYEAEKRTQEINLLNRDNALKTAELANQELQQRIWWSLAALFALSFFVVALLYRKLRWTNQLLAQKNAELIVQSSRDPLTGLYNRRYFQDFISDEDARPERRRREDDHTVRALLLIDVDHFKETNDRFGHALGDAVLVAVARRLRDTLRETDMIVRWGGEEFLVLARTNESRLDELAARILHAISAEPITLNDKLIWTTVSIGYVPMPLPPAETPLPWDRAIGLVDMALYMAKVNGRNRGCGIQRLIGRDAETLAAAERDLEHACTAGLVELHVVHGRYPAGAKEASPQVWPDPPTPAASARLAAG